MGKIAGVEELRKALDEQLKRAANDMDANPALLMIKPEDGNLAERLGRIMLELDVSEINFGSEKCPQFIDYVASYENAVAIILEKGCKYGEDMLKQITDNILTKAEEGLGAGVHLMGMSLYRPNIDASTMLAEAYKQQL